MQWSLFNSFSCGPNWTDSNYYIMPNFLQRISNVFFPAELKESASYRTILADLGSLYVSPKVDMEKQSCEGYRSCITAYSCVNEIATSCASIPWQLFDSSGENELPVTHPILKIVNAPNPRQGKSSFIESLVGYLQINGNSYIERAGEPQGTPELHILRASRVVIHATKDPAKPIDYYEYSIRGQNPTRYLPEQILHIKLFNPTDDFYGLSPIQVAGLTIDTDTIAILWNYKLLCNSARPSGIFTTEGTLSDDEFKRLQETIKSEWSGPAQSALPKLIENGLKWQATGFSPTDMDWLQGRKLTKREICQAYQVPPELIGDSESKTYSNYQEARKSFYTETILPLMDKIRDELNSWLVPWFDGSLRLDYDRDDIDALQEDRGMVWVRIRDADWLTLNEKRMETGFEAFPGEPDMDVPVALLAQRAFQPLADPSVDPSQDPAQAGRGYWPGETKLFKLDSEEKKSGFWRSVEEQRLAFERSLAPSMKSYFRAELEAVRSAIIAADKHGQGRGLQPFMSNAVKGKKPLLATAYRKIYTAVAPHFFDLAYKGLSDKKASAPTKEMRVFFNREISRRTEIVQDTTIEKLKRLIGDGILGGKSTDDIVGDITAVYDEQFIPVRSVGITSNEVAVSSNLGVVEGAKATGKPLMKSWLTQRDDRVRNGDVYDHVSADSQQVDLDSPFIVSNEKLNFPNDTSLGATAGNVINCRCFVTFTEQE